MGWCCVIDPGSGLSFLRQAPCLACFAFFFFFWFWLCCWVWGGGGGGIFFCLFICLFSSSRSTTITLFLYSCDACWLHNIGTNTLKIIKNTTQALPLSWVIKCLNVCISKFFVVGFLLFSFPNREHPQISFSRHVSESETLQSIWKKEENCNHWAQLTHTKRAEFCIHWANHSALQCFILI